MDTRQLKQMKRFRLAFRFIGAMFVLVGSLLLVNLFGLLFDPSSTIVVNGVATSDFAAKVHAVIFVGCFVLIGLFSLFGPTKFFNKLFVWRQSLASVFSRQRR